MASVSKVSAATKPLLSQSSAEARRRVLNLYRAWYREVIEIGLNFVIVSLYTALYLNKEQKMYSTNICAKLKIQASIHVLFLIL
jgi:hypothetical protein